MLIKWIPNDPVVPLMGKLPKDSKSLFNSDPYISMIIVIIILHINILYIILYNKCISTITKF